MVARIDLAGQRFGRLIAIERNGFDQSPSRKHIKWDCICDCGNLVNVRLNALRSGSVKSCGCLFHETKNTTHGMSKTREYQTWARIKDRCYNADCQDYLLYGARGIRVCDEWLHSFESFYRDMGDRPDGYSIDRINSNGNYEPGNCRWASNYTQTRNKRSNRNYEFNGKTMCLSDWAKHLGISPATLDERLRNWPLEKSLTTFKEN